MDYNKWIKDFMNAWKEKNVENVIKTISKNCKYYETVFDKPCSSFEDIKKLWEVVPINQKNIEYDYKIILENDKFCIINFFIKRTLVPSGVIQNID
jgi:phenylacetate-coenzyme A ligase PaaK-like adenylate-forming protein